MIGVDGYRFGEARQRETSVVDDREDENRDSGTMFIGVGHARGAGLGAAFGAAFGQVALGVPRGAAVGLVAGVIASRRARAIHVVFPTARRPA